MFISWRSYKSSFIEVHKFTRLIRMCHVEGCSNSGKKCSDVVMVPVTRIPLISQKCNGSSLNSVPQDGDTDVVEGIWRPSPYTALGNVISHYKQLSKFRLTSLVVITAMSGYAMAPTPFDIYTFSACSLGTGLVSAAANAINQYHEVPFDSQMSRTKNRVLVTGQLAPLHCIGFALLSATTGLSLLYFGVNGLTAALGFTNLILYTAVYTPLKRVSILNTWIGSLVGAIPPLMGWAGSAGNLDAASFFLAGVLFAWQFPHFNALSWNLRPDYSRAGYRMMAVTNPALCRRTALKYTAAIAILSALAPFFNITSYWFLLESVPLNAYFCYLAFKFYQRTDSNTSRTLFRFSLIHLPCLMLLFLLNKQSGIATEKKSFIVGKWSRELPSTTP
ncbi:protoheme IX farnesyltransferase, mitochondrial isoform X1 [Rhagoletis pomonella]|uniref:protoheme IX farnesyltransferase, mitochondrial isoform X1 n=2 Tax=Rhagoletis pomonella TaxID=28610 RepID=UPI0017846E62|nr:protoheme IX farnesyltransferase, mitochondrial isoform X1 [Rhagoletis pomonella]XP_036320546.1 protoheme IX farnesyltransferase, mitochondrial isoform X1 [Rhagoletis pomonella]